MYRVRTQITGGLGGPYLSTMYFSVIGGLTAANANAAVGAFWGTMKAVMSTSMTATTEGEVAELDVATGQVTGALPVTSIANTGTASGDTLPPAVQGLIRWRTGTFFNGREVRGRTFIPGPGEALNTNGVPTSVWLSAANTAAANLIADPNSDFQIYTRKNHNSEAVITGAGWTQWAVLRSRRD